MAHVMKVVSGDHLHVRTYSLYTGQMNDTFILLNKNFPTGVWCQRFVC